MKATANHVWMALTASALIVALVTLPGAVPWMVGNVDEIKALCADPKAHCESSFILNLPSSVIVGAFVVSFSLALAAAAHDLFAQRITAAWRRMR